MNFHSISTGAGVGLVAVLLSACATGAPVSAPPAASSPTQVAAAPVDATTVPQPTSTPVQNPTAAATAATAPTQVTAAVAPTSPATAPIQVPAPVSAASIATPTAGEQVDSPGAATEASTIASRLEADVNSGHAADALALFADGAEVKVPPDRYVGAQQISNWLNYLSSIHFEIEPGFRRVVGGQASWPAEIRSDYLDHIGLPSLDGEASIVIKDGRITNYTFFLTEDSARRHRDAVLAATEVEQDPLIVGQDAANVYSFKDVFFDPENNMVSYRDVLTSDAGAGPFHDVGGEPVVIHSGY